MLPSADLRAKIVAAAHGWLDTPYHHQARVKGVGVDCAQLVAAIGHEVGLIESGDIPDDYSPEWHLHNRSEVLMQNLSFFGCVETSKPEVGDILCFKYGRAVGHIGILVAENVIIHARMDIGKVVLNTLTDDLKRRHTNTFTFPGISNDLSHN